MSVMCLGVILSVRHDIQQVDECHVYMTYDEVMRHVATARAKRKARTGTLLTRPHDNDSTFRRRHAHDRYPVLMSSGHDKSDALSKFQAGIKSTVAELLSERDEQGKRWTTTSIAKAGNISRNQLYAWMGQGPQRLKRLPDRERVVAFYRGVKKSEERLFQGVGWEFPPNERVLPRASPPHGLSDPIESKIRLLRLALDRPGIGSDERRELDIQLIRLQAAQQMNDDAIRAADEALKRHKAS